MARNWWLAPLVAGAYSLFAPFHAGRADEPAPIRPERFKADKVLFLGNSLTLHPPAPEIGWPHNYGMAASAQEKDYVHVLTSSIAKLSGRQPDVLVKNIYEFETQYDTYDLVKLKKEVDFRADIVVVAIGECVPAFVSDDAKIKFKDGFDRLLAIVKNGGHPAIFVLSCFWPDEIKDKIMKKACAAAGGVFVDISKLAEDESNYARWERKITNPGVGIHPGDKGMKRIADSLLIAMASGVWEERKGVEPEREGKSFVGATSVVPVGSGTLYHYRRVGRLVGRLAVAALLAAVVVFYVRRSPRGRSLRLLLGALAVALMVTSELIIDHWVAADSWFGPPVNYSFLEGVVSGLIFTTLLFTPVLTGRLVNERP